MKRQLQWLLQILLFTVLIIVGGWMRVSEMGRPLPLGKEAEQILCASRGLEPEQTKDWEGVTLSHPTLYHRLAGQCASFVHTGEQGIPLRCYRLLSVLASLFILALIPMLGLRRRNGVFESADGPLWAMGVAAFSPILILEAMTFDIFSFQCFLFLILLLFARAYAQWPGFLVSIAMGILLAVAVTIDGTVAWTLAVLVPTICVGVGWTRLCLYWRTWHVVTMVAVCCGLLAGAYSLDWLKTPSLPMLPENAVMLGRAIWWRIAWVCMGGIGILAWIALVILSGFRSERRWMRVLVIVFPACFVGSLFFRQSVSFIAPLVCLTPIMVGLALSGLRRAWLRGVVGGLLIAILVVASWVLLKMMTACWGTRAEQRNTIKLLHETVTMRSADARVSMRIVTDDLREAYPLVWPLRFSLQRIIFSPEVVDDTDILIVSESKLDAVPTSIGRRIRPGVVRCGHASFRIFVKDVK